MNMVDGRLGYPASDVNRGVLSDQFNMNIPSVLTFVIALLVAIIWLVILTVKVIKVTRVHNERTNNININNVVEHGSHPDEDLDNSAV